MANMDIILSKKIYESPITQMFLYSQVICIHVLTALRLCNLYTYMYLTLLAPRSFGFVNMCLVNTVVLYYNETDL